ncbi:MAG: cyclic pyranopterin monophosphate synthase MoaC [Lachnospiraceae bacterium]
MKDDGQEPGFTHFDGGGNAIMVDVTEKPDTEREAVAVGHIMVNPVVYAAICQGTVGKGDVLGVARVAGIMATKRTSELIPMCHILNITKASIEFNLLEESMEIQAVCTVKTTGKTGVEMEAMMGVSVALLTIYDMCKAIDKEMEMKDIYLLKKRGGKSGKFSHKNK